MKYIIGLIVCCLVLSCTRHHAVECNRQGMDLLTRGNNEEALRAFDEAISIQSDFHAAYYNRAIAYANLGRFEDALRDMNYVITNYPDQAMAYYNRGIIQENLGQPTLAIQGHISA